MSVNAGEKNSITNISEVLGEVKRRGVYPVIAAYAVVAWILLHIGTGSLIVLGEVDRAKRWLRRALEIDPDDSILLYNVACNYATMGEIDDALDYLQSAVASGMVNLAWVSNDKDLDVLRTQPRFQSLLHRIEAVAHAPGVVAAGKS